MDIYADWISAKAAEEAAVTHRRAIEDQLVKTLGISADLDCTKTVHVDGYTVKIVGRVNRTVDGNRLQELARENGLEEYVFAMFRWKPEINASAWKATGENVTRILSGAVTAKPGRPSFTITKE